MSLADGRSTYTETNREVIPRDVALDTFGSQSVLLCVGLCFLQKDMRPSVAPSDEAYKV